MKELILMTAAFRIDNLVQSFDSIEENFKNNQDVHVTWLICYDKYNAFGNIEKVKELCQKGCTEFGMGWLIYDTGKPSQKNYGGDMYNEPLKWIKENWFKKVDPWVYIYDDDNIIHSSFSKNFTAITDICEKRKKEIIWMNSSNEYGDTSIAFEHSSFAYHIYPDGKKVCFSGLPDPSQLLMKYSTIEKMGFFNTTFQYDRYIWWYIENHLEDVIFPNEWLEGQSSKITTQIQSFHNGQLKQEYIDNIEKQKNRSFILISQGNGMRESDAHGVRIVLPKEIGETSYRLAKEFYGKKGYIQKTGVFDNIDKIYILTQTETPERWNYVINQFKALNIYDEVFTKIEVVKGVKIPVVDDDVIRYINEKGLGNPIYAYNNTFNVSFFNCTIEHYRILSKALSEGYERILVIEDDACFLKNIEALKHALNSIPTDFDILHLEGYLCMPLEERQNYLDVLSKTEEEGKWIDYNLFPTWASACLLYSKNGIRKFVEQQKKYLIGIDNRTGGMREKSFIYNYPLVKQNAFPTSICGNAYMSDNTNLYLTYTSKEQYFTLDDFKK